MFTFTLDPLEGFYFWRDAKNRSVQVETDAIRVPLVLDCDMWFRPATRVDRGVGSALIRIVLRSLVTTRITLVGDIVTK